MTSCRLWHLPQTALSDWLSLARRGSGGATSAVWAAANKAATSKTPPMHVGKIGFETSAMFERLFCGDRTDGSLAGQGDGRTARHRRDMRTDTQLFRSLVVAETIAELVRNPLGVAIVESDVQQLFAVHGVP